jgi:hypothetical protein
MLPSEVGVTGIEEDTLFAAGIIYHTRRQFVPIGNVYKKGPSLSGMANR